MKIAVQANDVQWKELVQDNVNHSFTRVNSPGNLTGDVEAFLLLNDLADGSFDTITKPVLVNAVCSTLSEMHVPENVVRINGWNSFLSRARWEVAGRVTEQVKQVILSMGKEPMIVADQEGFVSARIISMIINEAYFALGEGISTKEEIDIAMKSGTNYPYGPFEWASVIGVDKIFTLLQKLSTGNKRYLPAPLLKEEATK